MTGLARIFLNKRRFLLLLSLIGLIGGCANQVALTGGEKDKTPPGISSSVPMNGATNYSGNEIILEFDEFIATKNPTKELIVSPPLKYPVEFKTLRGQRLQISWKDTLAENTTYLFQFGKGIVDYSEGNALDSNVFVFSTGAAIDSLQLKGRIIDAFTGKGVDGAWAMLYESMDDSLPYEELPRYFAKTDKGGNFELRYLRPGNYKLFGLLPENQGYLYDTPKEQIAFEVAPVTPYDPVREEKPKNHVMQMFLEDDSTQFLRGVEQNENMGVVLAFNRPVENLSVAELTGRDMRGWVSDWSKKHDTLTYWFDARLEYDSMKLDISCTGFHDTVFLRKPSIKSIRGKGGNKPAVPELRYTNSLRGGKQDYFNMFKLQFKTPVHTTAAFLQGLLISGKDTLMLKDISFLDGRTWNLNHPWKQEGTYTLWFPDSAFVDRYGTSHDTIKLTFEASRKEDYGQMEVVYELPDQGHTYVWQLLQDAKVVEQRIVGPQGKVRYDLLPTGSYQIRVVFDVNQNGAWDTGYYRGKRQPERVVYYNQAMDIRSNWLSEFEWQFNKPPAEAGKK